MIKKRVFVTITVFVFLMSFSVAAFAENSAILVMGSSQLECISARVSYNGSFQNAYDISYIDSTNSVAATYRLDSNRTQSIGTYASYSYSGYTNGILTITVRASTGTAILRDPKYNCIQVSGVSLKNYSVTVKNNAFVFEINGNIPQKFEVVCYFDTAYPETINDLNLYLVAYMDASFVPDYSNISDEIISNQNQNTQEIIGSENTGGLKGIFAQLKELPNKFSEFITNLGDRIGSFFTELKDNLINGIKDLFVPSEEDINSFKDKMQLLLSEHLGVIYQVPDFLIDVFQTIVSFEPENSSDYSDYYIEYPAKSIYINADKDFSEMFDEEYNAGVEFILVPDNTGQDLYRFDFGLFNDEPFSTYIGIYKICANVLFIGLFVLYCMRKYELLMEG